MAVSTKYGPTPWSTGELAHLHGTAGPRAKRKQEQIDELIVECLAPAYVRRGTRADQAAASVRAHVARMHRLFELGGERFLGHVARLIRLAYDRQAERRLHAAAKRLPARINKSTNARNKHGEAVA